MGSDGKLHFARLQTQRRPFAAKTRWFGLVLSVRSSTGGMLVVGVLFHGERVCMGVDEAAEI